MSTILIGAASGTEIVRRLFSLSPNAAKRKPPGLEGFATRSTSFQISRKCLNSSYETSMRRCMPIETVCTIGLNEKSCALED